MGRYGEVWGDMDQLRVSPQPLQRERVQQRAAVQHQRLGGREGGGQGVGRGELRL